MKLTGKKINKEAMKQNLEKLINDISEVQALFVLGGKIIPVLQDLFVFLQDILPLLQEMHESILASYEKMPQMSKQLDTITTETEIATTQILDLIDTITEQGEEVGNVVNTQKEGISESEKIFKLFAKDMNKILNINKKLLSNSSLPSDEVQTLKKQSVATIINIKQHLSNGYSTISKTLKDVDQLLETNEEMQNNIFLIMNSLQFQDITTQQIQHANSIMDMIQRKLYELLSRFTDATNIERLKHPETFSLSGTFDPKATIKNSDERQAIADQLASQDDIDKLLKESEEIETEEKEDIGAHLSQEELDKLLDNSDVPADETDSNEDMDQQLTQEELDKLLNNTDSTAVKTNEKQELTQNELDNLVNKTPNAEKTKEKTTDQQLSQDDLDKLFNQKTEEKKEVPEQKPKESKSSGQRISQDEIDKLLNSGS